MLLLFLSLTGVFLSLLLIYFNGRKYPSSIYLSAFFFLVSLYAFIQYSLVYSHSVLLVSFTFIQFGVPIYLTGPFLYFYIRCITDDKTTLSKPDLFHLLPMLVYIGMAFPYFIMPWSYKSELASQIVNDFNYIRYIEFYPLFVHPFKEYAYLSRPLLVLAYLIWSFFIFLRYLRQKSDSGVFSGQKFMVKWIMVLFGSLFILLLSHLFLIYISIKERSTIIFYTANVLQIFSGVGLISLLVSPFLFPQILYGFPRIPANLLNPQPQEVIEPLQIQKDLIKSEPEFEVDYLHSVQEKSEAIMRELKPYLHKECNLPVFSKITNIPAHHLTYYFREIRKQSFNDFKNEWRVKHAKELLKSGKHTDLTIEAIGQLSGFSSRNTFFRTFKKFEGVSPGEHATNLHSPKNQSQF